MQHVVLAWVLFCIPFLAAAGSGDMVTGSGTTLEEQPAVVTFSGATLEQRIALLREQLGNRTALKREQLTPLAKKRSQHANERMRYRERRDAFAAECILQLRRANRDQKFPVSLRCYRGILLTDVTYLRKREDMVAAASGVSSSAVNEALAAVKELTDAITIVANAIDAGVYETIADMLDVKIRLLDQYRYADMRADVVLKLDRYRGWLTLAVNDLEKVVQHAAEKERPFPEADWFSFCLKYHVDMLDGIEAMPPSKVLDAMETMKVFEDSLPVCTELLRNSVQAMIGELDPTKVPQSAF